MNAFEAMDIVENMSDVDEATHLEAWQLLIDTGVVWSLQGWYGREAKSLIERRLCQPSRVRV